METCHTLGRPADARWQMELEKVLSLDLVMDKLTLQLNIANNLETAFSFAKLHILHSSMIQISTIQTILNSLKNSYEDYQIPKLQYVINYYTLFSTKAVMSNNVIIFQIHVPTISNPYNYFKIYPVYQNNYTIIPETPFLMFNTEKYWNSRRECERIENIFYCNNEELFQGDPCLEFILKNATNRCPLKLVYPNETLTQKISPTKILINPKESTRIHSSCMEEGISFITKPTLIQLGNCEITIKIKKFSPSQRLPEETIFKLPSLNIDIPKEVSQRIRHVSTSNHEDINHIKAMIDNLHVAELSPSPKHDTWINTSLILTFFVMVVALTYLVFRKSGRISRDPVPQGDPENGPNQDPLFSHFKEG